MKKSTASTSSHVSALGAVRRDLAERVDADDRADQEEVDIEAAEVLL